MNPAFVMPFARLEAWAAAVEEVPSPPVRVIAPDQLVPPPPRVYPPCPSCGRVVTAGKPPALTLDLAERTATFGPCGCVVSVPDVPQVIA